MFVALWNVLTNRIGRINNFQEFIGNKKYFMLIISLFSCNNYNNSRNVSCFLKISKTSHFVGGILGKIIFGQKITCGYFSVHKIIDEHIWKPLAINFEHLTSRLEDHHMHVGSRITHGVRSVQKSFLKKT